MARSDAPMMERRMGEVFRDPFYTFEVGLMRFPFGEVMLEMIKSPGEWTEQEKMFLSPTAWRALLAAIPRIEALNPAFHNALPKSLNALPITLNTLPNSNPALPNSTTAAKKKKKTGGRVSGSKNQVNLKQVVTLMDEIRKCLEKLCAVRESRDPTILMQPTLEANTGEPPITPDPSGHRDRNMQSIENNPQPDASAQLDDMVVTAPKQGEPNCEFVKIEPLSTSNHTGDWLEKTTYIPLDDTPNEVLVGGKAKRDPRKRKAQREVVHAVQVKNVDDKDSLNAKEEEVRSEVGPVDAKPAPDELLCPEVKTVKRRRVAAMAKDLLIPDAMPNDVVMVTSGAEKRQVGSDGVKKSKKSVKKSVVGDQESKDQSAGTQAPAT